MENTNVPAGYKLTELGVLPEEWEVRSLRTLLLNQPDYGINAPAVNYSEDLPTYLRITDISEDGSFISSNKASVNHLHSANYHLGVDEIVFARTGASTGKTYLHTQHNGVLVFAGFLIRAKPDPKKLDVRFLKAFTQTTTYWKWVAATSMRSGQPGINGVEYGRMSLPLPPLPEQRAIAAALGEVDALLAVQRARLAKQRAVKQGMLQTLLSGEKRLPGFAGAWDVRRLGDVVGIKKGRLITEKTCIPGRIPVIAGGQLPAYYHNAANRPGPTITISASGAYAGYVGYHEGPIFASDCSTIEGGVGYNLSFVYAFLKGKQQDIYRAQTGGAQPHIHPKDIAPMEFNVPPIAEQRAIAAVLSEADAALEALEAEHGKTQRLKQGLMQNLLTGTLRLPL